MSEKIIHGEPQLTRDNSSPITYVLHRDVQEAFGHYLVTLKKTFRGINKSYAMNKLLRKLLMNGYMEEGNSLSNNHITIHTSKI